MSRRYLFFHFLSYLFFGIIILISIVSLSFKTIPQLEVAPGKILNFLLIISGFLFLRKKEKDFYRFCGEAFLFLAILLTILFLFFGLNGRNQEVPIFRFLKTSYLGVFLNLTIILGIFCLFFTRFLLFGQSLILIAFLTVSSLIFGYLYEINIFSFIHKYTHMTIASLVCYAFLSSGLLLNFSHTGIVGLLLSKNLGGTVFRRLLPVNILFPIIFGLLIATQEVTETSRPAFMYEMIILLNMLLVTLSYWLPCESLK